ncbi:hypothetical protein A3860_05495 [Niastella vici]|uniref:Glycosyl transferase n=1 Tax=Niastella vici TaxID=1703345 RepID=A0A1V9FSA3_9BACT|nr:DUF6625 family protein [Niastella vici]OQP61171.1 hypothetical protein A3860_05495 [Niastella vici]
MSHYKHKIAFLVCYFGKLPWYFDYFIHSCKYNPSVDFYIVTDDVYKKRYTKNVKFIYTSLEAVSKLTSKRLGFTIKISHAYKLCDFKPAYGYIFNDILKGYDFWGHGDIDIIFGNIRSFMTRKVLSAHDIISVRPDWIPGCFVLFRNSDKLNTLFKQSKDYKKVFKSDTHYCFDETNFAHDDFTDGKKYDEVKTEIESMMHVIQRLQMAGYINVYFDLNIIEGIPGKLKWNKGTLVYRNKYYVLLYHLIKLKKIYIPKREVKVVPDSFIITPSKIMKYKP